MRVAVLEMTAWVRKLGLAVCLALAFVAVPLPAAGDESVSVELVLALDGSNSVSDAEFQLQLEGLAQAFSDTQIIRTIEGLLKEGVAVTLMQWSNAQHQVVSIPWRHLQNAQDCQGLASDLRAVPREVKGGTAINGALDFGRLLIAGNGYAGHRKVIDVSGDGPDRHQAHTRWARDKAVDAGITINGLTILDDSERLDTFYRRHVIGGAGAFVMTANSFADYAAAMREKLLRELGAPQIARPLPLPQGRFQQGMTESVPRGLGG